jgi:myosin heavy subunit
MLSRNLGHARLLRFLFFSDIMLVWSLLHRYTPQRGKSGQFRLRHFAGEVTYTTDGWLNKNRDALLQHLEMLMLQAKNAFVRDLFLPHTMATAGETTRSRSRRTMANVFRAQLNALLGTIQQCGVFHVRCVPANGERRPALFDAAVVAAQLRHVGALEAVRVRRAGFALRRTFAAACRRYRALLPPPYAPQWRRSSSRSSSSSLREPDAPDDARGACLALLDAHLPSALRHAAPPAHLFGRTKLFLSAAAARHLDTKLVELEAERLREEAERARQRAEAERRRKEEEEARQRAEAERRRQQEAERQRREEQQRREREEAERARVQAEREAGERRRREEEQARQREAALEAKRAEERRRDEQRIAERNAANEAARRDLQRAAQRHDALEARSKLQRGYGTLPPQRKDPPVDGSSCVCVCVCVCVCLCMCVCMCMCVLMILLDAALREFQTVVASAHHDVIEN